MKLKQEPLEPFQEDINIINQESTMHASTEVKTEFDVFKNQRLQPNLTLKIKEEFQEVPSEVLDLNYKYCDSKSQTIVNCVDLNNVNCHKVNTECCISSIHLNLVKDEDTESKYTLPKVQDLNKLITDYCDLPTLKNDVDYLNASCSSKQYAHIGKFKHDGSKKKVNRYTCAVSKKNSSSYSRLKLYNGQFWKLWQACEFCGHFYNKYNYFSHYFNHFVKINSTHLLGCRANKPSSFKNYFKSKECKSTSKHYEKKRFVKNLAVYNNQNTYKCDICSKEFTIKKSLDNHLKKHNGKKPFSCKICLKQFTTNGHLKEHFKIHSGEKPFNCTICLKQFTQKSTLNNHFKIHTGEKPFKCEICLKQFRHKGDLNKHLKIHTGEKPFKCDICLKQFTQNAHIKDHVRIHTGEKPFQCKICSKQFNRKSVLNDHLKIHAGEKSFKCEVCSKEYVLKRNLNRHCKTHTSI